MLNWDVVLYRGVSGFVAAFMLILGFSGTVSAEAITIEGTIDAESPFLTFPVQVDTDGDLIVADIRPISGNLDTLLYLVDAQGVIVAQNDDRTKGDTSSRIVFPGAAAGEYMVVASRFNLAEGDSEGDFSLTIEVLPQAESPQSYAIDPAALLAVGFPEREPAPTADWTILAYYGGDTNLEAAILDDLDEFERAGGSTETVRIIALMDRHPDYSDSNGNWSSVRLFEIGSDISDDREQTFPPTIDSVPLADLGPVDSGSGELFAQFLVWAIQAYPARQYALALASHGAGWQGIIADDTDSHAMLTLPELDRALTAAEGVMTTGEFVLLVNDACLMSSVEYYNVMDDYFTYSLASPEVVVTPALDMSMLTTMLKTEDFDVQAVGRSLINTYMTRDLAETPDTVAVYLTSSIARLDAFDLVVQAVEAFAAVALDDVQGHLPALGQARAKAYTYAAFQGENSLIDLGNFMRQVIVAANDPALIEAAQDVLAALDGTVLYGLAGDKVRERTSYYNIYFPREGDAFEVDYFQMGGLPTWAQLLRAYFNALTPQIWVDEALPFHVPMTPKVRITKVYPPTASIHAPVTISMETEGRRIAAARMTVDQLQEDGSSLRLLDVPRDFGDEGAWPGGALALWEEWDTTLATVSDGEQTHFERLMPVDDVWFLEGRYRTKPEAEWNDVALVFAEAEGSHVGQVQQIVSRNPDTDAMAVISIEPGWEFQAYRFDVTADGRVAQGGGNSYGWPEDGLTAEWDVPAPDGAYQIGFDLTAYGGATGHDSAEVIIQNAGLDRNLRGLVDSLGFALVYPAEWFTDILAPAAYLSVSDETQQRMISVYAPELFIDGDIIDGLLNWLQDQAFLYADYDSEQPVTVDGVSALAFDFTDDYDSFGRAILVDHDDFGPMVFAISAETESSMEALYDQTLATLRFTELDALFSPDDHWAVVDVGEVEYALPQAWWETTREDGVWWQHRGPAGEVVSLARIPAAQPDKIVEAVLTEYVQDGGENFSVVDTRSYYADNLVWQVTIYTIERDGQRISGRVYATTVDHYGYVVWMEAPFLLTDADAVVIPAAFPDTLELILDSVYIAAQWQEYDGSEAFGFSLRYPAEWVQLLALEDGAFLESATPNWSQILTIVPVDGSDVDVDDVLTDWEFVREDDFATTEIDGITVQTFTFGSDDPFILIDGRGFAVALPEREQTLVFLVENYDWFGDDELDMFDYLLDNLRFGVPEQSMTLPETVTMDLPLQTHVDELFGIAFDYPALWSSLEEQVAEEGTWSVGRIYSPITDTTVDLIIDTEGVSLQEAVEIVIDDAADAQAVEIIGQQALAFSTTSTWEDGPDYVGYGFAIGHPDSETVFVLMVDGPVTSSIEEFYRILQDSLKLFPPQDDMVDLWGALKVFEVSEFGVTFEYPEYWSPVERDEGYYVAYDDSSGAAIFVEQLTEEPASVDAVVEDFDYWYEPDDLVIEDTANIDGLELVIASYTVVYESESFDGVLLALENGVVITVEMPAGDDLLYALGELILETLAIDS